MHSLLLAVGWARTWKIVACQVIPERSHDILEAATIPLFKGTQTVHLTPDTKTVHLTQTWEPVATRATGEICIDSTIQY